MELIKSQINLPSKLEDLTKFILIGREKLNSVRAEIRAINKLGLAKEVREQKRDEAQMLAGALLDAESKIGEITLAIPKDNPNKRIISGCKSLKVTELGLSNIQVSQFQQLSENQDIIEQVKAEAIENDDLPTRTEVLRKIKEKERNVRKENYKKVELPSNKYRIIYADPPWKYNDKQDIGALGGAIKHYQTMELDEICLMPIKKICQDDAVLFLWTTSPFLEDSFNVIKAWEFEYKSSFIWDKVRHNMGHYNSVRHELLLICTKGSCTPDNQKLFDSVQTIEKTSKHSEKPEEFRKIIETLYTHGKKIELFARKKTKGWDIFGNEL